MSFTQRKVPPWRLSQVSCFFPVKALFVLSAFFQQQFKSLVSNVELAAYAPLRRVVFLIVKHFVTLVLKDAVQICSVFSLQSLQSDWFQKLY